MSRYNVGAYIRLSRDESDREEKVIDYLNSIDYVSKRCGGNTYE